MPPSLVTPLATDKTMQDDFQPVRYIISGYDASKDANPSGDLVAYTDFLAARSSRDHWKGKAARWEAEAKSQESVIQHLEVSISQSCKEVERLRADVKRLTSIIDLNTDDKGRDLRALTEEVARLRERLQCLGEPLTAPLTRYQR